MPKLLLLFLLSLLLLKGYSSETSNTREGCDLKTPECFPINNIEPLVKQFRDIAEEEKLFSINNLMDFKKWSQKAMEVRSTEKMGYGLFALEKISKGDLLFSVPLEETISGQIDYSYFDIDRGLKEIFKYLETPTFEHNDENLLKPREFQSIFSLLFHLYRFDKYWLKDDLLGLPMRNEFPVFTMTQEEISLLPEGSKSLIEDYKNHTKNSYYFFLNKTDEVRGRLRTYFDVFNVPFEDFAYAVFLLKTRFISVLTTNTTVLIPGLHYMNSVDDFPEEIDAPMTIQTKQGHKYYAYKDFQPEEEILGVYALHLNLKSLLTFGIVPDQNKLECIEFKLIEDKRLLDFGFPDVYCINEESLHTVWAVDTLVNMNTAELEKCVNILGSFKKDLSPKEMSKVILTQCTKPDEETKNIWNTFAAQITKYKEEGSEKIMLTKNQLIAEGNAGKTNLKLIKKFWEFRLRELGTLEEKTKDIRNDLLLLRKEEL